MQLICYLLSCERQQVNLLQSCSVYMLIFGGCFLFWFKVPYFSFCQHFYICLLFRPQQKSLTEYWRNKYFEQPASNDALFLPQHRQEHLVKRRRAIKQSQRNTLTFPGDSIDRFKACKKKKGGGGVNLNTSLDGYTVPVVLLNSANEIIKIYGTRCAVGDGCVCVFNEEGSDEVYRWSGCILRVLWKIMFHLQPSVFLIVRWQYSVCVQKEQFCHLGPWHLVSP